ncbi:ABC transporter G family member 23-like [Brevipalpus obovatus]|uniref:ABC transporter G family member 23-like n=1 Tax=Brevipalpus obovatus TaxID=246614 RepID=UPI003D9F6E43
MNTQVRMDDNSNNNNVLRSNNINLGVAYHNHGGDSKVDTMLANEYAIYGRDLRLDLGTNSKRTTIFRDLRITVPTNCVYGLIGPSGCGKTTLQRCVFGFFQPQGTLLVFGRRPNHHNSHVPGPIVGFMPQDLALNEDLSVREMLTFFGKLFDLSMEQIDERINELLKVIDIREQRKLICQLSLGQRRRVSMAATLIHRPRLLLLDEPTVGSDPLLVHKMWQYLFHLRDNGTTIVVTTHYLEEIVKADRFGLMRNGQIIVEDNPMSFIAGFGAESLEKAVFKLCSEWDAQAKRTMAEQNSVSTVKLQPYSNNNNDSNACSKGKTSSSCSTHSCGRMILESSSSFRRSSSTLSLLPFRRNSSSWSLPQIDVINPTSHYGGGGGDNSAPLRIKFWTVMRLLMWRLLLRTRRFMIFPILLSCLIIFIISATFGLMFGRFPENLRIGYTIVGQSNNYTDQILNQLRDHKVILISTSSAFTARQMIENGSLDGHFTIGESFIDNLEYKLREGIGSLVYPYRTESHQDEINLLFDVSNRFKVDSMRIWMNRAVDELFDKIRRDKRIAKNAFNFVRIQPIFDSPGSSDHLASKDIVVIRYFLFAVEQFAIILLLTWTIKESKERMNERLMAAGVQHYQLTIILAVGSIMIIAPIYCVLLALLVPTIDFPSLHDAWWPALLIVISLTVSGVAKGITIGLVFKELPSAVFIHSAYCFSSLFIGYLLWPYESLPAFMKPLTFLFPFTFTGDSMTNSLIKSRPLSDPSVLSGVVYGFTYAISFLLLTIWLFRKW